MGEFKRQTRQLMGRQYWKYCENAIWEHCIEHDVSTGWLVHNFTKGGEKVFYSYQVSDQEATAIFEDNPDSFENLPEDYEIPKLSTKTEVKRKESTDTKQVQQ